MHSRFRRYAYTCFLYCRRTGVELTCTAVGWEQEHLASRRDALAKGGWSQSYLKFFPYTAELVQVYIHDTHRIMILV